MIFTVAILMSMSLASYSLYNQNKSENKISALAAAEVGIVVQQLCGDTYCNSPETCSSCTADCGSCPATITSAPSSGGRGGGGGGNVNEKQIPLDTSELFDVTLELQENYNTLPEGAEKILFKISLIKFKLLEEQTEARIVYGIYKNNNRISEQSEEIIIQRSSSFVKEINLPKLEPGTYTVKVSLYYNQEIAESISSFSISSKAGSENSLFANKELIYPIVVLSLISLTAVSFMLLRYNKIDIKPKKRHIVYTLFILIILSTSYFSFIYYFDQKPDITGSAILRPREALFDLSVRLQYEELEPGNNQIVTTKIINAGLKEAEDIIITYTLLEKDKKDRIVEISETIAVQTSISTVRNIYVPEYIKGGNYIIEVIMEEKNGNKTKAHSSFLVKEKNKNILKLEHFIISILLFFILITIFILLYIIIRLLKKKNNL